MLGASNNQAEVQALQELLDSLRTTFAISERLSEQALERASNQDMEEIVNPSLLQTVNDLPQLETSCNSSTVNQTSNGEELICSTQSLQNNPEDQEGNQEQVIDVNEDYSSKRLASNRHNRAQSHAFNFQQFKRRKQSIMGMPVSIKHSDLEAENIQEQGLMFDQIKKLICSTHNFIKSYEDLQQQNAKYEKQLLRTQEMLQMQESKLVEMDDNQKLLTQSSNADEFLRKEIDKLDASNTRMKDKIAELWQDNEELKLIRKNLSKDHETKTEEHLRSISDLEDQLKQQKIISKQFEEQFKQLQNDNSDLMMKNEDLKQQLLQKDTENYNMNLELQQLEEIAVLYNELQQEHKEANNQLDEFEQANQELHLRLQTAKEVARNSEAVNNLMFNQQNLDNSQSFSKQDSVDAQTALDLTHQSKVSRVVSITPTGASAESFFKKAHIDSSEFRKHLSIPLTSITPRNQVLDQASNQQDQEKNKRQVQQLNCLKLELGSYMEQSFIESARQSHHSYEGSHRSRLNSSNVIMYTPANISKQRINTARKDSNKLQINVISDNCTEKSGRESPKYYRQQIRTSEQACQTSPVKSKDSQGSVIKEVTSEGQSSGPQIKPFVLKIKQKPEYKPEESKSNAAIMANKYDKFKDKSNKNFNKWLQDTYQKKDSWNKYGKIIKNETKFDSKALVAKYKSAQFMLEKEKQEQNKDQPKFITSNLQVIGEMHNPANSLEKERTHISKLNRGKNKNQNQSNSEQSQISPTTFTTPTGSQANQQLRSSNNTSSHSGRLS